MIFTQPIFLLFFAVCFFVHWSLANHRLQKTWLLACSYFFYGSWDWRFLSLIFASTVVDFLIGLALERFSAPVRRKTILAGSVLVNLGFLGFFKYYNFFAESGAGLLASLGAPVSALTLHIVLPVGISFFTFQSMSYTIDVYRRELPATRSFLDFALFVSFFPQLVAGPIVRARDLLPQFTRRPVFAEVEGRSCLVLFLVGFFKKACLADNIARAIDPVFADPSHYQAADVALSSVLYSVQIYCDFSGYTDMAIATAGMLGYKLVKNFDYPFLSRSVQEFWRRWHMSLSTWLRDYLYLPLGGGRGGRAKVYRNIMLTMLLGGLWHGANMTFVVWGALHGAALVVHRVWRGLVGERGAEGASEKGRGEAWSAWDVPAIALTFLWVVLGFAIFRSTSLDAAVDLFARLGATRGQARLSFDWWLLFVAMVGTHWFWSRHESAIFARARRLGDAAFYLAYGVACAALPYLMSLNVEPFIYFQF